MGQKINPTGLRIGVIKDWESRWYANKATFGDTLVEDYELREYLLETLAPAGVPKVEIERTAKRVRINIHVAKPGMVIGRGGAEIEKLKATLEKKIGKEVSLNIIEIKTPDVSIKVAPDRADLIETRVIGGVKYILICADENVEVNGVRIHIGDEEPGTV